MTLTSENFTQTKSQTKHISDSKRDKSLKPKGVRQKMTEKKALANESEDVSKTRIKQLSVELTEETQQPKRTIMVRSNLRQKEKSLQVKGA